VDGSIDVAKRRDIASAGERGQRVELGAAVVSLGCRSVAATGTLQHGVDALKFLVEDTKPGIDGSNGSGRALGECVDLSADWGEVHVDSLFLKGNQRVDMRRELGDRGSIALIIRITMVAARRERAGLRT